MSSDPKILSHKMARLQKRYNRNHAVSKPRLDLLPVELQLAILQSMSCCEDLYALVVSSPNIRAVYYEYKKTVLARVLQATLGDAFIEACMLQYWRTNNDTYIKEARKDEEDESNDPGTADLWYEEPCRHVQLKFLHDWYEHSTASTDDQIQNMKRLLTAEDFEQITTFYQSTIKPLSRLFIENPAPVHDFAYLYVQCEPDPTPLEPWNVTVTEWQRIMRTLYRFEICCRLYEPTPESNRYWLISWGTSYRKMMRADFFGMLDASEIEEFSFVYVQLAFELHKAVHLIESNEEWREAQGPRANYTSAYSPWRYRYYIRPAQQCGLGGWVEGTLSKGLGLLSTIRSAGTPDKVADIMIAENPPALMGFMWDTIIWLREAYHFSDGGESAFPESWCDGFWE